jgi:hypothetical protein
MIKYNCFATKGVESIIECGLNEKQMLSFYKKYRKLDYQVSSQEIKSLQNK